MKRPVRYLPLTLALLASSYAHAKELPNYDAYLSAKAKTSSIAAQTAANAGGFVASTDANRGVPTFFWATKGQAKPAHLASATPAQLAGHYIRENAKAYGLTEAAINTTFVQRVHDTGRGGIIVVLRQRINGVEVLSSDLKVLLNRQG